MRLFRKVTALSQLRKIHSIEAALKLVRGIGNQPRIQCSRDFPSEKIRLGFGDSDRPAVNFAFRPSN